MTDSCDAIVIGGGPGGATAALALARAGWNVAVIERKSFPRRKVCGEYLSGTNWPLFDRLGLADEFDKLSGPEVRRVGLFAGSTALVSDLPLPTGTPARWGRALSRQHLDTLLMERAQTAGARVLQPWRAIDLSRDNEQFLVQAAAELSDEAVTLRAPVVIAAHGSWDAGPLPTQLVRRPAKGSDLLGFKAHFLDACLPADLMPLLCFPGGYGGMVCTEGGRTSLSCCVRRDAVEGLDRRGSSAGQAVLQHILRTTPALEAVLSTTSATDGAWLSAGPIRPGIRPVYVDGVYRVGNAAGEAHPVVAEGISMAMQSSMLLAERLIAERDRIGLLSTRDALAVDYRRVWRASFAPRIRAAAAIAHWAMRRAAVNASLPVVRRFPRILTWGARLSGKSRQVVR